MIPQTKKRFGVRVLRRGRRERERERECVRWRERRLKGT
jgi:hypothetical protein